MASKLSYPPYQNSTSEKKREQKPSTDASVLFLQKEVQHLTSVIKDMKSLHLKEMENVTKRLESQTEKLEATLAAQERMGKHLGQVCEFINSLQSTC